jgi:signal transduction histidine kinase
MFARIRWHLVGWNLLVVGLILGVLGTTLYVGTSRNQLDQLDRDLADRGERAAVNFRVATGGEASLGREGFQGGVFYLLLAADGRVLANPQSVDVAALAPPAALLTPGTHATTSLDGESIRLYSTAARPPGAGAPAKPGQGGPGRSSEPGQGGPGRSSEPGKPSLADLQSAVVVVGTSLAPVESANRLLLLFLVVGGAAGLVLSLAGAWFLAGRSMVPIEQAFQRQQEFVADASHELRTPLTVVRSAMDLLYQELDAPLRQNVDLVDQVRDEVDRLQRLVGDLLTLARSDRGQLELALAPLNARVMAAEAVRRLGPLAQERGVELAVRAPEPAPTVEADPDRLRQVLLILLDNALEHTPAGGTITVGVRREDRHVAFEVADTGAGIAPEHLPRLFERFYRASAARTRGEGRAPGDGVARDGTGLGLAIAQTIVQAHGGELAAESAPGRGTRMTVRLPAEPGPPSLPDRHGDLAARITHVRPR